MAYVGILEFASWSLRHEKLKNTKLVYTLQPAFDQLSRNSKFLKTNETIKM